jgi:hypothetical protein
MMLILKKEGGSCVPGLVQSGFGETTTMLALKKKRKEGGIGFWKIGLAQAGQSGVVGFDETSTMMVLRKRMKEDENGENWTS